LSFLWLNADNAVRRHSAEICVHLDTITTTSRNADPSAQPLAIIGMTALVALFRFRVAIILTIAACGAARLMIRLLGG
jgi:hypothetical protein